MINFKLEDFLASRGENKSGQANTEDGQENYKADLNKAQAGNVFFFNHGRFNNLISTFGRSIRQLHYHAFHITHVNQCQNLSVL